MNWEKMLKKETKKKEKSKQEKKKKPLDPPHLHILLPPKYKFSGLIDVNWVPRMICIFKAPRCRRVCFPAEGPSRPPKLDKVGIKVYLEASLTEV